MVSRIIADLLLILHLAFIVFVVLGGCFVVKWRHLAFIHIPAALWGALIEFQGWFCPLTPLEQYFRKMTGPAYQGGFVEHYLVPLIYPAGLTRKVQIALGLIVVAVNIVVYCFILARLLRKKRG